MILDIVSADASWADNKLSVSFDVVPAENYHLDLTTGEIFQSRDYAALRTQLDKTISARLYVTRREHNAAGAERPSEMRYFPGNSEDGSEIRLVLRLPDDHLAGFHSLILAGKLPMKVHVWFENTVLEMGWEPDGSRQKWNNEMSPAVPIEDVWFAFSLQAPSADHLWNTAAPADYDRAYFLDTARVNYDFIRKLSSIESKLGSLSSAVWLIALLMLFALLVPGSVLSRFWN